MPGTTPWLCLSDPEDIKKVFRAKGDSVHFAEALRMLSPHELVLGPAALTSLDGEEHLTLRRTLMPLFTGEALRGYEPLIESKARELSARIPTGRPIRAQDFAQEVTLEIVMSVVFGVTDPARLVRLRDAILSLTGEIGSRRFLVQIAVASVRREKFDRTFARIEQRKAAIDSVVKEEIAARAGDPGGRRDALGRLLTLRREGQLALSDDELCDQLRLLLLAGHDTTATTIAWTLERLIRHPGVVASAEHSIAGGDDAYLDAVIQEALRLRPVAPLTVRLTKEPLQLDDLLVPAGTLVMPYIALVHLRADVYPEPDAFRPERFLDTKAGAFTWLPFGGGARRCLGAPMAQLEARIVLRALLSECSLAPTRNTSEPIGRVAVFQVPGRGAEMLATRRAQPLSQPLEMVV